jgi:DNA repair protein RecO (recombination protein O)
MDIKSRGIIVRNIKYGDASAICNILTEEHGLLGFHIPGVYKNKGKIRLSHLRVLNTVEISLRYNKSKNLQRLIDIHCHSFPELNNFSQQAFYHVLCELLQHTIKENEVNPNLFEYLYSEALPALNTELHYWQLPFFMLGVLHHYGCAPNCDTYSNGKYLDLENGVYLESLLPLKSIADPESSSIIYQILQNGIAHLPHNNALRSLVVNDLIRYYKYHISADFELRSMEILQSMAGA